MITGEDRYESSVSSTSALRFCFAQSEAESCKSELARRKP